jgi:starch-binding outer membrane protein, SusD/RagB family
VNTFSATDVRGNHGSFMISPYADAYHAPTLVTWSVPSLNSSGGAGAAFDKYLDETNTQNETARSWEQQGNGWPILRYADVLLMYAEAVNNGGTPTSISAAQALNMVRQRGDPNASTVAGLGSAAFFDTLQVERRKEFIYEGSRWFDLSRWGLLDSAITVKTGQINTLYPNETTPHGTVSNLFPIPLTEIQVNPKLTQNPGY